MTSSSGPVAPEDRHDNETGGVAILLWPAESSALEQLAEHGTPRLVVVEDGCEPPVAAECCQDWMWRSGTTQELRLRLRQLALRALAHAAARPFVDGVGMLHVGLRSVHLTGKEQRMVEVLIDRFGERVSADDLMSAGWPERRVRPTLLAPRISVLRRRIAGVGLELPGSMREGYALQPIRAAGGAEGSVAPDLTWFDAELDASRWLRSRLP